MKNLTKVLAVAVVATMALSSISVFAADTETTTDLKRPAFAINMKAKDCNFKFGKRFELTEEQKAEMALVDLKAEVWEQLDKLTDERQKRILWLRYAEHKKGNFIADDLELSPRHVRRLHRKTLENFEKIL